jgi:hypothetical protein
MDQAQIQKVGAQAFRLARRFMEIWTARTAACATQANTQLDGRIAFTKARYQISWVNQAPVLAAAADRNQGHLSPYEFA